ncbi:DUF2846 domain-containing protein [Paucibacter sp. Y2R2-4]|uniref:DUF2846 domain-containing protein n=1 Tax=Paucibacter sp. Y2R2-4 TaxID=2893553 RepID=UPI0021E50B36|nr:DUF2846 domain-containing protein [Paucibacter sp. Y2R2-4]MCV2351511.1 DUF2846 domain-containing protein [Paucibacter sp. Y2R2-4]
MKRFEVPAQQSRIYIYRNEFLGTLVGLELLVDGRPAGTTKGKTFVVADVDAGEHQLVSKGENTHTLTLTTRAGEPSFVWQEVKMGLLSAGSRLHSVDAATGRAGVMETQLVGSPLMKSGEAAPPAAAVAPMPTETALAVSAPVSAAESYPVAAQVAAQPSDPVSAPAQAQTSTEKPAQIEAQTHAQTPAAPEAKLRPSRFDYEAERAAKEAGCLGPNGERPMSRLLTREGVIESFTVQCAAYSLRVRCDMGMCRVLP